MRPDRDKAPHDKAPHDDLDSLLDGVATGSDRAAAEKKLAESAEWQQAMELQEAIDAAIRRRFPIATAPSVPLVVNGAPDHEAISTPGEGGVSRRAVTAFVLAASLLGIVAGTWWWNSAPQAPFFEPRPVAQIYRDSIAAGFEPYYECTDPERFAAVFRTRQEVPLELKPMPEGMRMLGLSYPGGLSRDTTAMLCEVEGEPVMVFVDRVEADFAGADADADPSLRVFREEREGLVFYEVTPLRTPQMTSLLRASR